MPYPAIRDTPRSHTRAGLLVAADYPALRAPLLQEGELGVAVDFGVGEFADFVEVTEGDEEDAGTYPVLAEGPPMVALYLTVTGHATR